MVWLDEMGQLPGLHLPQLDLSLLEVVLQKDFPCLAALKVVALSRFLSLYLAL